MNNILIKAYTPGAAVTGNRIVKFSADETVIQATGATDLSIGVSDRLGALSTDPRVDVAVAGIVDVEYGDTVSRGAKVTSDTVGKAVPAAPATGANAQVAGIAMIAGVVGDIGKMLIAPSVMQGA